MDTTYVTKDRYEVRFLFGLITLLVIMTIGAFLINIALINIASKDSEPSFPPAEIYV